MISDYFKVIANVFSPFNKADSGASNLVSSDIESSQLDHSTQNHDLFFEANNENTSSNDSVFLNFISFVVDRFKSSGWENYSSVNLSKEQQLDDNMTKLISNAMKSGDDFNSFSKEPLHTNDPQVERIYFMDDIVSDHNHDAHKDATNHDESTDLNNIFKANIVDHHDFRLLVNEGDISQGKQGQEYEEILKVDNDDVIWAIQHQDEVHKFSPTNIINFDTFKDVSSDIKEMNIANDIGSTIRIEASDVLDFGNNLVITGNELDFIELEGDGWAKLDHDSPSPQGIKMIDGYDVFIHDSGAIVQIEHVINTSYFDPNSGT